MSSLDTEQVQSLGLQRAALRMDLKDTGVSKTDKDLAEKKVSTINEQLQAQEEINTLQSSLQEKLNTVLDCMSQIKDVRLLWNWDTVSQGMTHPSSAEAAMLKKVWQNVVAHSQNELALNLRFPLELETALRALWKEEQVAAEAGLVSLYSYNHNLSTVTVKLEKPWVFGDRKGNVTPDQRRSIDIDNEYTLDRKLRAFATGRRDQIIQEIAQKVAAPIVRAANFDEIAYELGKRTEDVHKFSEAIKSADLGNISQRKLNDIFLRLMDIRNYFARTYGGAKDTLGIVDLPEQGDHHGDISDPTYDALERLIASKVVTIES